MPSVEDYIKLRRMGSAQQEFADMQQTQGAFIERTANALLGSDKAEKPAPMDERKKKVIIMSIKKRLPKLKDQTTNENSSGFNSVGVKTGFMTNKPKPYI